jgi:hypothetical protein
MRRINAGWWCVTGIGCFLALPACGGSSKSAGADSGGSRSASGNAGSAAEGAMSQSGGGFGAGSASAGAGGRNELGGAPAGGGTSLAGGAGYAGFGGADACVAGAPCNCKSLVGITQCSKDGAECICPPSAECKKNKPGAACFEACGGEPFGVWRLAESCFSGAYTPLRADCEPFISAKAAGNEITMRLADGGEISSYGGEHWTVASQVPLACLGIESVNRCKDATFYTTMAAFTWSSTGDAECTANACGVCDCNGEESTSWPSGSSWSRSGNQLTIGGVTLDYCVQGDSLWIGGKDPNGEPKAAYRFSKQSCAGKPIPCAERTALQCEMSGDCIAGHCKGKTPAATGCSEAWSEADCGVTEGCVWETGGCYGEALTECYFEGCDTVPGCAWGPPKQHCSGEALPCCQGFVSELGECGFLDAAGCLKAAGCTLSGGVCSGEVACASQTESTICSALGCNYPANCKPTKCSELSVAACHSVQGCRVEW